MIEILKSSHGGARTGAGKKKGTRWPSTLAKEVARELVRQKITTELEPILDAHIANAKGIRHFILRNKKTGKFERITDPDRMVDAMNEEGGDSWEIWERDPNTQSAFELLNRALDKPKEQEIEIKINGEAERVQRLMNGRKRAREAR